MGLIKKAFKFIIIGFVLLVALIVLIDDKNTESLDSTKNKVNEISSKPLTKLELANKRLSDAENIAVPNCIVAVQDFASITLRRSDIDKTWGALEAPKTSTTADYSTLENPNFIWEVNFGLNHFEIEKTGETFGAVCRYDPNNDTTKVVKLKL